MKGAFAAAIVVVAMLAAGPATARPLNVTGSSWSPYMDETLPNNGLAAELVGTALRRAGFEVEPTVEAWSRAYEGSQIGVYDVVAAMWQSRARERQFHFSKPYLYNDIILLGRVGDDFPFNSMEDLYGLRIGVVKDFVYDDAFDNDPRVMKVVSNHLTQSILLLRGGRVDLVVGDKWSIAHELATFLETSADEFQVLPKPLARRGLRLAVTKENPNHEAIVAAFETAMEAMRKDGTHREIVRRHTKNFLTLPSAD